MTPRERVLFHIVQPYTDGPRRLEHVTVVSSHRTATEAFAELARVRAVLRQYQLPAETLELIVVTDDRQPVPCPQPVRPNAAHPDAVATMRGGR